MTIPIYSKVTTNCAVQKIVNNTNNIVRSKLLITYSNSCLFNIRKSSTAATDFNYSNEKYQYLQKSTVPMLHFQPSLPRLPIPQLDKTCERYLLALQPILDNESYNVTKDIVKSFCHKPDGIGIKLQKLLKDHDSSRKHTSYISAPWFDLYLSDRQPLPINYNPLLIMKMDENPKLNDQLIRSTNLIISSLRFMRSLHDNMLEPEVFHLNPKKSDTKEYRTLIRKIPSIISTYVSYFYKAYPLDMSQYNGLFCSTRIPELDRDRIYQSDSVKKHLLVMFKGHFYTMDVLDDSGNIEPPQVILGRLSYIVKNGKPLNENPLGYMTCENRNEWSKIRKYLVSIGNQNILNVIDSALFCLCLDETTLDAASPIPMVRNMLCGDAYNRWFDKSFSLIVAKDGTAGINFEHSPTDGVAILRLFNEIYKETISSPFVHPNMKPSVTDDFSKSVNMIDIIIDEKVKSAISTAKSNHKSIIKSLDMNFMIYNGINKKMCKEFGISPDSFMQLGFQLAFLKQYGKYVSTYESCSTAAFRHGRTEAIRPCTNATRRFCDAVTTPKSNRKTNLELREMIQECSKIHNNLTKEAAMGQGFDRHLFGLKIMANLHGLPIPKLYTDKSYQILNHNILSTSTLSSPALLAGGFGPVTKDGFGIAYNIQDEFLGIIVSNYVEYRNGKDFIDYLLESVTEIKTILESTSRK